MDSIQFYHATKHKGYEDEYTAAINVPPVKEFFEAIKKVAQDPEMSLRIAVGYTRVVGNDQYNKKTGREYSKKTMFPVFYKFKTFRQFGDTNTFELTSDLGIVLTFEHKKGRSKLHLISVEI